MTPALTPADDHSAPARENLHTHPELLELTDLTGPGNTVEQDQDTFGAADHDGAAVVPVAELFYSFQGEGPNLGRRALFARFMGCNLTCGYAERPREHDQRPIGAMACDTEYTWRSVRDDRPSPAGQSTTVPQVRNLTLAQLWRALMRLDPATTNAGLAPVDLIVVTGGEPMMRQGPVQDLARRAAATGRVVEVETNATITPSRRLLEAGVWFNASPKLASSAVPLRKRIKAEAITALQASGRTRWKFVVADQDDVQEVGDLQHRFGLSDVWLSPEGITAQAILQRMPWAAEAALANGWHLTTREHVLIWGNEHGR